MTKKFSGFGHFTQTATYWKYFQLTFFTACETDFGLKQCKGLTESIMERNHFELLQQRINQWHQKQSGPLYINGITPDHWGYLFSKLFLQSSIDSALNQVIVCQNQETAEDFYFYCKQTNSSQKIYFYPGLENSPYSQTIISEQSVLARFKLLGHLAQKEAKDGVIIITTIEALFLKVPPLEFWSEHLFEINCEDIISPYDLAQKLVALGYARSPSVEEPGTFASRGEIFDIYTVSGQCLRLHYFDDLIESIKALDPLTQKTITEKEDFKKVSLLPSLGVFTDQKYRNNLRENIPMPTAQFKQRFSNRKFIFEQLTNNQLFENVSLFVALFFENPTFLKSYLPDNSIYHFLNSRESQLEISALFDQWAHEFEDTYKDVNSSSIVPELEKLYFTNTDKELSTLRSIHIDSLEVEAFKSKDIDNSISLNLEDATTYLRRNIIASSARPEFIKNSLTFIRDKFLNQGELVFCSRNVHAISEFKHLLEVLQFDSKKRERISFDETTIDKGLFYQSANVLFLSDNDLFTKKVSKTKAVSQKQIDLFAEQLATLKPGDFVIHNTHGMGVYQGLESIKTGSESSDYIVIQYLEGDKVYVPVYKMNLIQKHADSAASLKPASLRLNKFNEVKKRARESAKTLAFDLLKLQAQRQSSNAYAFSAPDDLYREFELAFPFNETPDQEKAIEDVVEQMQKNMPMDYLVCGDVGFGKTEVAMRAAYKAVLDKKQVAVLVPTTILALQHYNSFVNRFKEFPVQIESISRFKTAQEEKKIISRLSEGKIDILIGTHKILSDKIKFFDLGLVIVDEEQRFGVGHKEKLKLLKSSVDFLTLTATPIPRTLQLAFLGLRDLSLIKTAPPKRQSIKTYIIHEDPQTIKNAIEKELNRGGQVFIVHNRVQDMEIFCSKIRELVPSAKIVFAHGQLPERELERRMKEFYEGKFQVLVATTIIESGLDIPNANTLIVDRADLYGLSQLHQLRGRIGRSDKKAYAYFVVPEERSIGVDAQKRLMALQTYSAVGSGFSLASCDLEIRGAGDILGADQSGHIEGVGLELYMELLKEAIAELKGEKRQFNRDLEISTPYSGHIPENYVTESSERLKLYKRLSNCEKTEDILTIKDEMTDIYGPVPEVLNNLITTLQIRLVLMPLGLKSIHVADRTLTLKFDSNYLADWHEMRDKILDFFISKPKIYQFTPDYRVIYLHKHSIGPSDCLELAKDIARHILPC